MNIANLETITGMQSWYKIWPLSGYNLIRANKNLSGDVKEFTKVLEPSEKPKKSFPYAVLWNWANPVKNYHGTIEQLHRSETNGKSERGVPRIEDGTSAVLLQSGSDKKWRADSMECCCFLRNVHDLLADGKTPYERRFGEPFTGPIIPFGSMIEYNRVFAKDQSRLHQFGNNVLSGIFPGYALYAGRIWKGDVMVADSEELENFGRVTKFMLEDSVRKRSSCRKMVNISSSRSKMALSNCLGESRVFRRSTSIQDYPARIEEHNDDLQGESEGSQPLEK